MIPALRNLFILELSLPINDIFYIHDEIMEELYLRVFENKVGKEIPLATTDQER
jgi:hypothetical protein